jgi:superoxide reductase
MTEKGQIYRCEVCANTVTVIQAGDGDLVCCDKKMQLYVEPREISKK